MLVQLGFERAFFNASLEVIRLLDGDIFLQRAGKYRFATRDHLRLETWKRLAP
jgi:hypothetical protein